MISPASAERTFTADKTLPSTLARDYTKWVATRPGILVLFGLLAIVLCGATALGIASGDLMLALVILVGLAGGAGAIAIGHALTKRSVAAVYPPGATLTAWVGEDDLTLTTAFGTQSTKFALFRKMAVTRNAVLLTVIGSVNWLIIPRALFTDADIEVLRSRIGHRRGAPTR